MINFNHWFYPVISLLSGILLMLLLPFWLNATLLFIVTVSLLVYQATHHTAVFWLTVEFITEFLGFCILVALFIGLTIGLNQFLI